MADSLVKRVVASALILTAVWIIMFFLPNWTFCLLTAVLIGASLYEFFTMLERKGVFVNKYFGMAAGIAIPIATHLQLGERYMNLEPLLIVMACLFTVVLQFIRRERTKDHLTNIALTLFALFYIAWFFSFFIKIKYLPNGAWLVAFLVMVTKAGDVGAYFIGKKLGKSPLIARISPKKTKEGAVGGLLLSVVVAVLCKSFLPDFSFLQVIFLGFLLGIIGQIGDLAESLFKRDFDVKDSGQHVPGLGGALDIIDSLLFTAPIFYFYITVLLPPL
ncbi:phosphatidate cytidylyltransferase [Candidatus Omnitrophota bacterium]